MALAEAVTKELEKQGITVQTRIDADKPVYSGRRNDGTSVILKTAKPQEDQREQEIQRLIFENEFNIQNAIGYHPTICQAYKLFKFEADGQEHYVLAVNFVKGKPLDAKQAEFYQHADGDRLYFRALRGASNAVRHLHSRGFVHLDIKPANIVVNDQDGAGVLIDFGSAKKEGEPYPGILEGFALCTPEYAPQEQLDDVTTKKSDIYQLGATILDGIACGERFYRVTPRPIFAKVHYDQPIDLEDANPALRKYKVLRNMLERARSNNPEARPSIEDMCEMIRDHERYFKTHPEHPRLLPYFASPEVNRTASTKTGII